MNLRRILRDERGFFPLALPAASILMKPIVWVSIALVLSLAGNATLWTMYKGELRRSGALTAERNSALAAGQACSEGVERLRKEGEERAKAAAAALARARDEARKAETRALTTLGTAPAVPGDPCGSAKAMNERKLQERIRDRGLVNP